MIKKSEKITKFRKDIDIIDQQIIKLLAKRFKISRQIALLKKDMGIPICDKNREAKALSQRKNKATKHDIDLNFIDKFFKHIFQESKTIQKRIFPSVPFDKKGKK